MVAIAVVTVIPCLLALIYIGSSTAFEDIVSLSVSGLYASYFIPCAFLLWRRTTGQIRDGSEGDANPHELSYPTPAAAASHRANEYIVNDNSKSNDVIQKRLVWGPWRVPGILGTINNAFACLYIVFVFFWSFWPPATPTTAENMNYSVLMTGVAVAFSVLYYYLWGKAQYLGPLIEREVRDIAKQNSNRMNERTV